MVLAALRAQGLDPLIFGRLSPVDKEEIKRHTWRAYNIGNIEQLEELQKHLLDKRNVFVDIYTLSEWRKALRKETASNSFISDDEKKIALTPEAAAEISGLAMESMRLQAHTIRLVHQELHKRLTESPEELDVDDLTKILKASKVSITDVGNLTILAHEAKSGDKPASLNSKSDEWDQPWGDEVRDELANGDEGTGPDGADGKSEK